MSMRAIFISFSGSFSRPGISSVSELDDLARPVHELEHERSSIGLTAAMYSLVRMTTRAIATRLRRRQRLAQQRVRVASLFGRLEIVRLVEEHRVDLVELDELDDVDRLRRLRIDLLEIFVGEHDVLALLVLVALDDLVPRYRFAVDAADALVLDAPFVFGVQQIKREIVGLHRRKELDGNRNEAEVDRP